LLHQLGTGRGGVIQASEEEPIIALLLVRGPIVDGLDGSAALRRSPEQLPGELPRFVELVALEGED
jgi:hypothetical protein